MALVTLRESDPDLAQLPPEASASVFCSSYELLEGGAYTGSQNPRHSHNPVSWGDCLQRDEEVFTQSWVFSAWAPQGPGARSFSAVGRPVH